MGDHRAHITFKLEMYGKTKEGELDINWCPGSSGIDESVIEWFASATQEFRLQWEAEEMKREAAQRAREEKDLYQRLKAKYEGPTKP